MTRQLIAGGWYGDHLPSGAFVVTIPHRHMQTHLGIVPFPAGETFGIGYPRCTDVGGFRFAGQAHATLDPASWEWDSVEGGWFPEPPPCVGVSPVIYDLNGVLHRSSGDVGSQGFRYVTPDNLIISGDETYWIDLGGGRSLFEWTDLGNGLLIGQGATDGSGVQVWDGTTLRQLELGDCRFVRANRVGEQVALAFTRPEGVVLMRTTMAELRALPPVASLPAPTPPSEPAPVPVPPPAPQPVPAPIPEPEPEETDMIAYSTPVPGFSAGELVANPDGTVSVLKPNGRYLCVTPEGAVEERDTPGGAWESFRRGKTSLIAARGGNVYVLPYVE